MFSLIFLSFLCPAADLLQQITEMLAAFSTSLDGSVSLADFERMMVVAGMV